MLFELWASWCAPCRKKNPGLIQIQRKYAHKKFTIVGISLEEKNGRGKWLDAIRKDGLTWPQLTDYKGWDNAVSKGLGIQSIPFNLLINPKGEIIGKNLYAENLEKVLDKVL